ncbi:glycogen/starch/alpha-glucan phosphorylase, partial [Lacticaseibacillus saniviri]
PDDWLRNGYVWETRKENRAVSVKFGGWVELQPVRQGYLQARYHDTEDVLAVPYDVPMIGYRNGVVNTLRLWQAEVPTTSMMTGTQREEITDITRGLYPDDSTEEGRRLRLRQEYFLVSAGIQSIVRNYRRTHVDLFDFAKHVAIHINDTHPAVAVAELMRILLDDAHMSWQQAWSITVQTLSYTNHTLLQEALEKWSIPLFASLLPRIYQIIQEIDRRFREKYVPLRGEAFVNRIAPLGDGQVRMAYLAVLGSHAINGVAKLHTTLLESSVLRDWYQLFPERFSNQTNGITPRRWIQTADQPLSDLLDQTIGDAWRTNPLALRSLHQYQDDDAFLTALNQTKHANKQHLAAMIQHSLGLVVDPNAIFDVQIKRLHAYKRQLLNVLGLIDRYQRLKAGEDLGVKRVHIFGAKAAPGYYYAKEIIKLINALADQINHDPSINQQLQIAFLPNYGVSMAEQIIPAADVSEQISLAGMEASGTSNMKLMAAGAVTLATLDGANIEIRDAVGPDAIVTFGLTADEVAAHQRQQDYDARALAASDPVLTRVLSALVDGSIPGIESVGRDIYDSLIRYNDDYFVLADFHAYQAAQKRIDLLYQEPLNWARMALASIAESGRFSADFTVQGYGNQIWSVAPTHPLVKDDDV